MDGNSGEQRVSKTVVDIWEEVQAEQRQFNRIMQILVALLIVAAVVAVGFFIVMSMDRASFRTQFAEAVSNANASAAISAGEAKREIQRMRTQLIQVQEDLEAQRQQAQLTRQVDQVLAASRAGSRAFSLGELKTEAVDAARQHLSGHRLNQATSYLVGSILSAPDARLTVSETALLHAALADWRNPTGAAAEMQAVIDSTDDPIVKGYGHLGLAQIHYAETNAMDDLGASKSCEQVSVDVRVAADLGVESMPPYLWKGECLRDAGNEREAFNAFAQALRAGNISDESLQNLRLAAHGAGTTLIARAARAPDAQLSPAETEEALVALEPIQSKVFGLKGASDAGDPLAAAYALLEYAANLRLKRGEGEVGKIYTAENIGFVFILREKWLEGYTHAEAIDKVIPMAWNLTVLHICASKLAEQSDVPASQRAVYAAEAERAKRVLSMMDHGRFGESELKKLLPVEYEKTVDELARPAREAKEAADAAAVNLTAGE